VLRRYLLPAATRKLQKTGFAAHHGDGRRDPEHKNRMLVWPYWVINREEPARGFISRSSWSAPGLLLTFLRGTAHRPITAGHLQSFHPEE
jgi:hypothetical protein